MYILAQLLFVSYKPDEFKRGMMFKNNKNRIYQPVYTTAPLDVYIEEHGYPVHPYIMSITANPDDKADIIATPEQIGWWDDGPQSDELRDVTLNDFNILLEEEDGILEIEMDIHDEDHLVPVLYDGKITMRIATDDDDYDEYDDSDDMDDNIE